jgi:predicted nicotinamide N-methyase
LRGTTLSNPDKRPLRVLELGAGDGSLMLGVARALAPTWPQVELTLLDRQALVSLEIIENYARLGWTAVEHVVDALEWAAGATGSLQKGNELARWDLIVANLFLHHFEGSQLAMLLDSITARSNGFFACEPRRSRLSLAGSHLAGLIGAGAVTREDAVLSVHAGFRDKELTALWPADSDEWRVQEYSAGLFSHCFHAERVGRS